MFLLKVKLPLVLTSYLLGVLFRTTLLPLLLEIVLVILALKVLMDRMLLNVKLPTELPSAETEIKKIEIYF